MDFIEIEDKASDLQKRIWRQKEHLWPDHQPLPIDMLKPEVAAHVLGLNYSQSESLAHQPFTFRGQKFKTAGLLDRQRKTIIISTDSPEAMKFTGA
ncbi:MAG: methenyltetrahydrofolate cyclohydrolase, partial [Endozoicomonadaceae bacterium]|nr:methenyltetrahydrofolate cyclohydrolase [Endozoicomonadaceae bacterium]